MWTAKKDLHIKRKLETNIVEQKVFNCKKMSVSNKHILTNHKKIQLNGIQLQYQECPSTFLRKDNRSSHMRYVHNIKIERLIWTDISKKYIKWKQLHCDECTCKTIRQNYLNKHIKNQNSGQKQLHCDQCRYRQTHLNQHKQKYARSLVWLHSNKTIWHCQS